MDTLKQQLLRIQQQLAGLSASQKMLTASLVAIMVMTMFYWSHYAGSAELVPLFEQTLSADEVAQIKNTLEAKGAKFEMQGDKIMVSPDAKFSMMADLGFEQALPRDATSAFDAMLPTMSFADSNSKTDMFYNHAREQTLAMMIRRWPGVKSATVMIDNTRKNSPIHQIDPSATVDIAMKTGEPASKKIAEAARMSVAGTQAGMEPKNVKVLIDGQSFEVANPDDAFGSDNSILQAKAKWQKYYADAILSQMSYIQGSHAMVSVNLMTTSSDIEQRTVDPKQKVSVLEHENTTTEDNNQGQSGGEPGAVPNIGVTADPVGNSPATTDHKETAENQFKTDLGYTKEIKHAPAGDGVAVRASVRVPESYFIQKWKQKNRSQQRDPTDDEIEGLVKRDTPAIREAVKAATNIKEDELITVASFTDIDPPSDPAATGLAALPITAVGFGAKEIAIGALAVISLFMVSMMVRKSAPQPQLATVGPQGSALGGALDVMAAVQKDYMNEVSEGGATMVGHELDDDAIEAKNVIEQVDAMVKANPDAAANLLKQWMRG